MITFVCTEVLTLLLSLETVGSTRKAEDWEDTDTFCCGKINRDALHRVLLFFSFIILSIYPFSKILKFKQQSFKLSISLNYIIWSLMKTVLSGTWKVPHCAVFYKNYLFSFVCLCSGSDKITSNCNLKYSSYVGHTIGGLFKLFQNYKKISWELLNLMHNIY